jgi:lipoprotein-releasing system permease protein
VGRRGTIESAMLRIVGIVETGSDEMDANVCQVALDDVDRLTGLVGAGEVAIVLDDWRSAAEARARLAPHVAAGDVVLTWGEITPELEGHLAQDKAMASAIRLLILLVVMLGVASAQLAAVLERRREFAILAAIGMRAGHMMRLVLLEALALGLAGAVAGLVVGVPVVWRFARVGLDFRAYMGGSSTVGGAVLEPIIYGDFGWWVVPFAVVVAFGTTVLASLYPAWFAMRTDPAVALRVAQ